MENVTNKSEQKLPNEMQIWNELYSKWSNDLLRKPIIGQWSIVKTSFSVQTFSAENVVFFSGLLKLNESRENPPKKKSRLR